MDLARNLPFSSVAGALRYQAERVPDKISLYYPDPEKDSSQYATLTFREFDNVTNHLALKIDKILETHRSNQTNLTCAILAIGGIEYLLFQYALLKINDVVMFPISARNSQPAIEHLLRETKTILLVTTKQFLPIVEKIQQQNEEFRSLKVLVFENDFKLVDILAEKNRAIDPKIFARLTPIKVENDDEINRIIVILHSSGSTAYPKPIYLTNRYFLLSIFQYTAINEDFWRESDVFLCWGALFHLLAFNATTRAIQTGFSYALPLCANFPPKPDELVRNIQCINGLTVLTTVPSLLEQLIRELLSEKNRHIGLEPLKKLRFVLYGGAGCPDDLCRTLVENDVVLASVYGSTETGISMLKQISPYNKRWKVMGFSPVRLPYIRLEQPKDSQNPNERILVHLPNDPFLAENLPMSENGGYTVGDILVEDPPNSGQYFILGRQDDILVHVNGEKTNPLPMEETIRECPVVKYVAIIGHNQFSTGAIVQLDSEKASIYSKEQIEQLIWTSVERANRQAPAHSMIVRSLIHILDHDQTIPVTHKGNVMRRKVNQLYSELISNMYDQFYNEKQKQQQNSARNKQWTIESIRTHLKDKIQTIINISDCSKSLFDFGITSLQVVDLRNWICQEIVQVGANFLYEHSSIDRMSDALLQCLEYQKNGQQIATISTDRFHYALTETILEKFIDRMKEENIIQSDLEHCQGRTFLITGGNGYLGNFLIHDLLRKDRNQVKTIYCLLRGSNPKERLFESLQERCFDISFFERWLDDRLIILPDSMDLTAPYFGQTQDIYQKLEKDVTDIIHCAWKVNFNQTVEDFQDDILLGHFHLLKLAMFNRKQFHFISSIASASSGLLSSIKEEPLPRNAHIALPQGYGQSKYIAEHLCWTAMNIWKVPASVYRVGQISGDTVNGMWNTTELAPMMIYAGAGQLKKMPNVGRDIRWIPINTCSQCIIDLVLNVSSFDLSVTEQDRVYHLINPHHLTYTEYLECLKSIGLAFDVVSPKDFLDALLLESNMNNPLVKLSSFLEQSIQQQQSRSVPIHFETVKTQQRCQLLNQCQSVDSKTIELYLNYWKKCQLL